MTETRTQDLGTVAARAVAWNYVSYAVGKALVLVSMAILARLLTPADFGMVGMATLVIAHLSVLQNLGLGPAVIQRQGDVEDAAQTVFVLNLVLGACFTAITIAAAPLVAAFFDEPLVTPLLRVLAFSFVLEAMSSMHEILLQKELEFRRKLIPDLGRAFVQGAVAVATAAAGFGVWALVWGQLAGVIAQAILAWSVVPWRPTYRFHRRLIRPLSRFGIPLVITDIEYAIWSNLDYVIVGRLLGDTALGIYTLAYRLPELLVQSVWRVLATAIFPFFSKIQHDAVALRNGFLATIRYTQIVIVPLCIGMFLTADVAVAFLFGDQWGEAVPVLKVMAVFSLIGSIGVNIGDVYKAIGRPDILAKLSVLELGLMFPALIIGARHGIVGVAWAHAVVATIDTAIRLVVARAVIGVRLRAVARQLVPSLLAGLALIAVAVPTLQATRGLGSLTTLLVVSVAGATAYLAALWRFDRQAVRRMLAWAGLGRLAGVGS
jgi:O-antigen/teichoic acid export membrane protein